MPITQITIENFKGIGQRIEIPIRPITLLFGANSTGKSTILQALLYLRELLERQNADADKVMAGGAAIDLGGFKQFVHKHELDRTVRIGITLTPSDDGLPLYPAASFEADAVNELESLAQQQLTGIDEISIQVAVSIQDGEELPSIESYEVGVNGRPLGRIIDYGFGAVIQYLDCKHPIFAAQFTAEELEGEDENPISSSLMQVLSETTTQADLFEEEGMFNVGVGSSVIPEWGKSLRIADKMSDDDTSELRYVEFLLSHLFVGAGELALNELQRSRYLGPIRIVPPRNFVGQKSPAEDRWADGTAAWDLLFQDAVEDRGLIRQVSNRLSDSKALNLGYRLTGERNFILPTDSLAVNTLQRLAAESEDADVEAELRRALSDLFAAPVETKLTITDIAKETTVNATDIGSGVSQVIPVLVSVLDRRSSITAIEQPELHIHPAVQCGLGDVFIREALNADDRVFLIETHSEHLLLRIMKRMRQNATNEAEEPSLAISPQDVAVLFVETYEGRSIYREMPLNERGEFIKAWPGGFFEEDLDEMI